MYDTLHLAWNTMHSTFTFLAAWGFEAAARRYREVFFGICGVRYAMGDALKNNYLLCK